jgi:hypothetical protein
MDETTTFRHSPFLDYVSTLAQQWPFYKQLVTLCSERGPSSVVAVIDINPSAHEQQKCTHLFRDDCEFEKFLVQDNPQNQTDYIRMYLVENASPAVIGALGAKFALDPDFFCEHAEGCYRTDTNFPARLKVSSRTPKSAYIHLNGISTYDTKQVEEQLPQTYDGTVLSFVNVDRPHYFRRPLRFGSNDRAFQLDERVSVYIERQERGCGWVGQ